MNIKINESTSAIHKLAKFFLILSFIPIIGLPIVLVPIIYSLVKKPRSLGVMACVSLGWNLFVYWFLYLVLISNDPFTDDLYIPNDIKINYPITLNDPGDMNAINWKLMLNKVPEAESLSLVAVPGNPGIYEYALWLKSKEDGVVYIKAFEVTKEIELSVSRLKDRSSLRIHKNSPMHLYHTQFTIYEGDWGYPYAARIELWFDSDASEKDEMLFSNNYVIEGWSR